MSSGLCPSHGKCGSYSNTRPHITSGLPTIRMEPQSEASQNSVSSRPTARLRDTDEPAQWCMRLVAGQYWLPDARNETLRPCRVRCVFVAKLLNHHPLLRADPKGAEDRERDQVRRTRPNSG